MATIESLLRKPRSSDDLKVRQCRQLIAGDKRYFEELLGAILHPDPSVRITAARIVDAVTEDDPSVAMEFKNSLIYKMAKVEQSEIRRHIAAVLPRLGVGEREYIDVAAIFADYLSSRDKQVREICIRSIDLFLAMSYPEESKLAQKFLTLLRSLRAQHAPPEPKPVPKPVQPATPPVPLPPASPASGGGTASPTTPVPPAAATSAPQSAPPAGFAPRPASGNFVAKPAQPVASAPLPPPASAQGKVVPPAHSSEKDASESGS